MPFRFDFFVQRMKHRQAADKPSLSLVEKPKEGREDLERKLDSGVDREPAHNAPRLRNRA